MKNFGFKRIFDGRTALARYGLIGCVFLLSACGGSSESATVVRALPPPDFDSRMLSSETEIDIAARLQSFDEQSGGLGDSGQELGIETNKIVKSCRIKDRFDTGSLLAYQMDEGLLSLDVDGLNHNSQKINKVYLNYTVSLQPELEKKDPCVYASAYRGLLGSAYSELVVHEGQNLSQEVDILTEEVSNVIAAFTP